MRVSVGQSEKEVRCVLNFLSLVVLVLVAPLLLSGDTVSELHKQGSDFYDQKKYPEAIAALEKAVQSEDPHSAAYTQSTLYIGQSYFSLQQPAKAILWLEKTAPNVEVNYMLGNAYLQTRDVDKAEVAFARLFGVPATSAAAHLLAAELMLKREYEEEAVSQVRQALTLDPKLPQAHFLLGEIAIAHRQLDEGIAELGQEIELNPNFSMAWYRLGEAQARDERWAAAVPNLERSIWLNSEFSGPFIVLGKCYFKTGNYGNAEGILRRGLTLDPNNYSATYLLGQTLMAEGKKDEGRTVLEKLKGMEHR
jgi:tetratricopeptide (TPR) repeat protein